MPTDDKAAAPDSPPPATHVEPPKIYLAACGVLCDIFWWARRDPAAAEQTPPPVKTKAP